MTRASVVAVWPFRNVIPVVASLMLLQVVHSCEAVRPLAVTLGSWAIDAYNLMCRLVVSAHIRLAAKGSGRSATRV
jgi:TRAP-type mannitol/chloroaromatic compound transport system permease small subunit